MAENFVTISQLLTRLKSVNIAADLDADLLGKIAARCMQDYNEDETSREDWMKKSKDALDLALQIATPKDFPFENASNVKYPQLTIAALQFHARAYPAVVRGREVVKCQVIGEDPDGKKADKADRISKFMSYQLLTEMKEWEEGVDRLLLILPILGCVFKKTYFSPNDKLNHSDLIFPQNLVINYKAQSLVNVPRVTHVFQLYPHEIIERQMQGVFLADIDLGSEQENEAPQDMLEQHCLIDLDEDGYKEPYIVTLHKDTHKILRITANYDHDTIFVKMGDQMMSLEDLGVQGGFSDEDYDILKLARITPVQYFTKFSFFPSPDGGIYDYGFGQILYPLNESINTSINQMIDAGTRQNAGGGFYSKNLLTDKKGVMSFAPGEYKPVDNMTGGAIRDAIYDFQHQGPSAVTMRLLELLIQSTKDMTSIQDIMVGGASDQETATTTLSRVDQGMKLFTAIYKRIYRSLKQEYAKLKRLNRLYLPVSQYFRVLDSGIISQIGLEDFRGDDTDVQPIADPTIASLPMKLAKAQVLKQLSGGNPLYNQREVETRFLDALEEPNIDKILLSEDQIKPPPDPKLMEVQAKIEKIMAELDVMNAEKLNLYSQAMKNMADAQAKEAAIPLDVQRQELEELKHELETMKAWSEEVRGNVSMSPEQRGTGTMEGEPLDQGDIGGGGEIPPGNEGAAIAGIMSDDGQPGEDGVELGEDSGEM